MNNILLDSNLFKEDKEIIIEESNISKECNIEVLENIKVNITIIGNNNKLDFNIKLNKNSSLEINLFLIDSNITINTDLLKESNFALNNSILNSIDSNNIIKVNHLEDKSISNIKNHGFSKNKAKLVFDVEGNILKEANKCKCNQDNQIIENENSFSTILPKLLIDNYDVEANHAAYVGEFKEKELFYLESRGISKEDSKFLLLNAFLIGILNIDEEYKSKIKDTIINYVGKEV